MGSPREIRNTRSQPIARKAAAFILMGALLVAPLIVAEPAFADTAPSSQDTPPTVTADALPTAQIDSVAAGEQMHLVMEVVGSPPSTVRAKAWKNSGTEPAARTAAVTDSAPALQTAGSIGLESYLGGRVTNGPVAVRYDDFVATAVG